MQVTSIAPCLILCAAFIALGALIRVVWPFYCELTGPTDGAKLETLDGLRGFLALGVFFHHGMLTYHWLTTGVWFFPPGSLFYELAGPYSVTLFFMITSFLFWTKAIRGGASVPPQKLLIGRVLRVGPMYLFVSLLIFGTLIAQGGLQTDRGPLKLAMGFVSPLTLGLVRWRGINGIDPNTLNAQVNWTLQYEWAFYLALPLLAFLATPKRFLGLAALTIACFATFNPSYIYTPMLSFLVGMAVAHSVHSFGPIQFLTSRMASVVSLALMVIVPIVVDLSTRSGEVMTLATLGFFFLCVVNGNTMFGALTSPGAKVVGSVSYSFYLTHGFVLYIGRSLLARWIAPETPSLATFWAFAAVCGVVTILLSAITYRYIEHPFIGLSHSLGRKPIFARRPRVAKMELEMATA